MNPSAPHVAGTGNETLLSSPVPHYRVNCKTVSNGPRLLERRISALYCLRPHQLSV